MSLLIRFINLAVSIYTFAIFLRAIISWFNPDPYNSAVRFLDKITEPLLYPIRKALWRFSGNLPIDFSPFIAIILVQIAGRLIIDILRNFI